MVKSLATKLATPPGFCDEGNGYTPINIKNKTCQIVDEPSCRINNHLALWCILGVYIAMYAASAVITWHHKEGGLPSLQSMNRGGFQQWNQ